MPAPHAVIEAVDARFEQTLRELATLARIPSVSAAGFDPAEVVRSAEAVAELLRGVGLQGVEILRVGDAHPYVVAEWRGAGADAPTVARLRAPRRAAAGPREPLADARPSSRRAGPTAASTGAAWWTTRRGFCSTSPRSAAWLDAGDGSPVNVKMHRRGRGGDRLGPPRGVPARPPGPVRLRRAGAVGHGEPRGRAAFAHHQPARLVNVDVTRARARPSASQRHVGRARPGRRHGARRAARSPGRRARGAGRARAAGRRTGALRRRAFRDRGAAVRRGGLPARRRAGLFAEARGGRGRPRCTSACGAVPPWRSPRWRVCPWPAPRTS